MQALGFELRLRKEARIGKRLRPHQPNCLVRTELRLPEWIELRLPGWRDFRASLGKDGA